MKSTISSKGQLTVPMAVRARLGLSDHSKRHRTAHPIDQLYGLLNMKRRTADLIDEMRGSGRRKP